MPKIKKNILLTGFKKDQVKTLKKIYKKINFIEYFINKKYDKLDALISINRTSFNNFYYNDFEKISPKLKWIHIAAAGLDIYPKIFKLSDGCKVTNGKIIQGPEVADHAMALLLSLTRNIYEIAKYGHSAKFSKRPIELAKKKLLIVGYGGVGKYVAERAFAFGMKISVLQKNYTPIPQKVENIFFSEDYEKAVKDQDVIIYTLPLTSKTRKMYNNETAKKFKKGAIVINVCRGDIICKKTLYKNLKNNRLGGAAVDVLESNDHLSKNDKLLKFKNFIFTPHIAGISDNLKYRNFDLIKHNLKRFSEGEMLTNIINKSELI